MVTILHQANHALKKSQHPAIRQLSVENINDSLIIQGKVPSWFLKQMAQETLMPFRGNLTLVNRVDVSRG